MFKFQTIKFIFLNKIYDIKPTISITILPKFYSLVQKFHLIDIFKIKYIKLSIKKNLIIK